MLCNILCNCNSYFCLLWKFLTEKIMVVLITYGYMEAMDFCPWYQNQPSSYFVEDFWHLHNKTQRNLLHTDCIHIQPTTQNFFPYKDSLDLWHVEQQVMIFFHLQNSTLTSHTIWNVGNLFHLRTGHHTPFYQGEYYYQAYNMKLFFLYWIVGQED